MIVRQSDNAEYRRQEETPGKSLSDNGRMDPAVELDRRLRIAPPRALLDRRPGRRGAAARGVRGRARVRDAAARGRARRVARRLAADPARGAGRAGGRGPGHPRAQPRRQRRRVPTPSRCATCRRARTVLETAGMRHWPHAAEEAREAVRRALGDYERAVAEGASYQELNQRHLAIHLSLVGLTGSPRLVVDGRVDRGRAPARPGPDRPGTPQRSRPGRLATTTCSTCSRRATSTPPSPSSASTCSGAEDAIIERLDLG